MNKIFILTLTCFLLAAHLVFSQMPSNRIPVLLSNGTKKNIFFNGGNLAWDQFSNDFGPGTTNFDFFEKVMDDFQKSGGNSMRLWVHITGANNPTFDATGKCIGLDPSMIPDMKRVLDIAYNKNIVLVLSLWSFDMLNTRDNPTTVTDRAFNILNVESNIQAYIDKALIPMVTAFKDHPAVGSWEIFNEPEGMSNEFGWEFTRHVPMSVIQRFVNRLTGAIHRTDADALVTNGTWAMYANTDILVGNPIYKNYYSDAQLIAAGGDPDGKLNFYQVHYYDWMSDDISVLHHPAAYWKLDKPILVGEFFPLDARGLTWQTFYKNLYDNGYAGAMAWHYQGHNGSIEPYRSNMLASMATIRNLPDIIIESNRNHYPSIGKISNAAFFKNAAPVPNYIDLDLIASDPDNDALKFSVETNSNPTLVTTAINASNQLSLAFAAEKTGSATIVIKVTDARGLTAITEFNIAVREQGVGNLALFRTTIFSSADESTSGSVAPINVADGSQSTRWSSAYADPSWIYIDLGTAYTINNVKLYWETAYGARYEIQTSSNATTWTTVFTEQAGNGGLDDITITPVSARYVRMYGLQRATMWGFSLYEFEIYGTGGGTINQNPTAVASATPVTGTAPLAVTFNASTSSDPDGDALTFSWAFGDNTTGTGARPSHTYTTAGIYNAVVTVSDGKGGSAQATVRITATGTVNRNPIAVATATPTTGAAPLVVAFNASGSSDPDGDPLTFAWAFGDNTTGTGARPSHTYTASGIYNAVVTVADGRGGSAQATVQITVTGTANRNPIAVATATPASGAAPLVVAFNAGGSSDPDNDPLTFSWTFGDNTTGTGATPSHTYAAGTYSALVTVSDGRGGSSTATRVITVTGGSTSCAFGTPLVAGLPTHNASYNRVHKLGTGGPNFSNVTNFTINWNLSMNGLWQMSFNTNNGNPTWWLDLRSVSANRFNVASPDITFTNSGFPGLDGSYWVGIHNGNFVMASKTGGFTLYFSNSTTAPTCTNARKEIALNKSEELTVYPNPSNQAFIIQLGEAKVQSIKLIDQRGRVVKTIDPKGADKSTIRFGEDLDQGLYILSIESETGLKTFRIDKH